MIDDENTNSDPHNSDDDESWNSSSMEEESLDDLTYDTDDMCIIDETKLVVRSGDMVDEYQSSWVRLPSKETKLSHWHWQIDVKFHGCLDVTSYLVHQHIVGFQSKYFKSVFLGEKVESTAVDLPTTIQQSHFEVFLDYLYSPRKYESYQWGYSTLLSILYMSDFFGVDPLLEKAIEQAQEKLQEDSVLVNWVWYGELYSFAVRSSVDKLKVEVERVCYRANRLDFRRIWQRISTPELKRTLFQGLLRMMEVNRCERSKHIIRFVFETDPAIINVPLFYGLFGGSKTGTPFQLNEDDALMYLKHEQFLGLDAPETDALTPLQEECVRTLSRCVDSAILDALTKLKPGIAKAMAPKHHLEVDANNDKDDDDANDHGESTCPLFFPSYTIDPWLTQSE